MNKKNWQLILGIVGSICSIISLIFSFLQQDDIYLLFFFITAVSSCIAIIFFLNKKRKLAGSNGVSLSLGLYLKKYSPLILIPYLSDLHDFFHELKTAERIILDKKIKNPSDTLGIDYSKRLLQKFQSILHSVSGVDFSVNIKLFERIDDNEKTGIVDLQKSRIALSTFIRVNSKFESQKIINAGLDPRSSTEKFLITKENSSKLNCKSYKVNTAYNKVMKGKHYWISGNLESDLKKKNFESNSNNYKRYYNSLGVFLISPPLEPGMKPPFKAIGLLIIDSFEINTINNVLIKDVVGYFAHLFYDFFINFNQYTSQNERKTKP